MSKARDLADIVSDLTNNANKAITVKSDGSELIFSTIQASEITTVGQVFSNWNTVSADATTTTSSTQNSFVKGLISVTNNAVWTIAGNGTLEILT